MASEDPLYMSVARADVRAKRQSSTLVVDCLLKRIDYLERQIELRESDD